MTVDINVALNPANGRDPISTAGFTDDQQAAYKSLIDFIDAPFNPNDYKRALCGAAGTGKTYLVKALIKNCKLSYSVIGMSAPTHKACRVLNESVRIQGIKANSLASDLGLRPNINLEDFDINNIPFDPKGQIHIENYRLYIVDEASMIPNKTHKGKRKGGLRDFLEETCVKNNCKILYIGDASQLPPVNEFVSSAFVGIKTCTLNQIVRQDDDNPVRHLLELLRYDIRHKSYTFIEYITKHPYNFDDNNLQGYEVLGDKTFAERVNMFFGDDRLTSNVDFAKIIAYTNARVSGWNKYIRNRIIDDADKSIITKNDLILSNISLVDDFSALIFKNSEEYIINDVVNYTHPQYGIKGFMVRFRAIHGGDLTPPLFVVDTNDPFSVQKFSDTINALIETARSTTGGSRATAWKNYFKFKENVLLLTHIFDTKGEIIQKASIDYGFALSAHKSQGSTYENVFVDVNNILYDKFNMLRNDTEQVNRLLYVACSRCKYKLFLYYGH